MLKKLLILPLIGGLMSFGAFASATDITISSDGNNNCSPNSFYILPDGLNCNSSLCSVSLPISGGPGQFSLNGQNVSVPNSNSITLCSSWGSVNCDNFDATSPLAVSLTNCQFSNDAVISSNYISLTLPSDTPSDTPSDDDNDNSTVFPTIPSSFTSGITVLVNNFGSVLVGWLPTIILVALGIYAIFALFRVVRNYAKSTFRG